jgi:hypothetical protein
MRAVSRCIYKPAFQKFIKKASLPLAMAIEDQVGLICHAPYQGTQKAGDLVGIWVSKFKFQRQQYLIAYRPIPTLPRGGQTTLEVLDIHFLQVGSHEKFYEQLKRHLKSRGH